MKKDPKLAEDRLISGKLRAKAGRRGAKNTLVSVDGTDYAWASRHGWLVWGKGIKALSISVSLQPGRTRELILDFTMKVGPARPSESTKPMKTTRRRDIKRIAVLPPREIAPPDAALSIRSCASPSFFRSREPPL